MRRSGRYAFISAAALICTLAASMAATSAADGAGQARPWAPGPCAATSNPVVKFTLRSGEVRHNADWLSVAVYADGCVWSHRPPYYTAPGDRSLRLSASEFDELMNALDTAGTFSFDAESVRRAADEIEREREEHSKRAQAPLDLVAAEGAPRAVFELDLSTELKEARGLAAAPGRRSYSWAGLSVDAKRYPEIPALANLEGAQRRLLDLAATGRPKPGEARP